MDIEKLIGKVFDEVAEHIGPFEIENNAWELELDEGAEESFYVTTQSGELELKLNKDRIIQTIFLRPDAEGKFLLKPYLLETGRREIRKALGEADASGETIMDEMFGNTYGYDRYHREIVYHFEYQNVEQSRLKMITLMEKGIGQ
ncbi:MAG: hypothetical protein AAFR87_10160 [Bacteroidota bacterium]